MVGKKSRTEDIFRHRQTRTNKSDSYDEDQRQRDLKISASSSSSKRNPRMTRSWCEKLKCHLHFFGRIVGQDHFLHKKVPS